MKASSISAANDLVASCGLLFTDQPKAPSFVLAGAFGCKRINQHTFGTEQTNSAVSLGCMLTNFTLSGDAVEENSRS